MQIGHVFNSRASFYMLAEEVIDRETFYSVLADWKQWLVVRCSHCPLIPTEQIIFGKTEFWREQFLLDTVADNKSEAAHARCMKGHLWFV